MDAGDTFHSSISGGVTKVEPSSLSTFPEESSASTHSSITRGDDTSQEDPSPSPASSLPHGVDRASTSASGSDHGGNGMDSEPPLPDHSSHGARTIEESAPVYNPLTHYLTGQEFRLDCRVHHSSAPCSMHLSGWGRTAITFVSKV